MFRCGPGQPPPVPSVAECGRPVDASRHGADATALTIVEWDIGLKHRAKKWEPVLSYKRCENKYLDQVHWFRFKAPCSRRLVAEIASNPAAPAAAGPTVILFFTATIVNRRRNSQSNQPDSEFGLPD